MRIDLTLKSIQNGWLVVTDISGKDMVTTFYEDELVAQIAMREILNKMIELTAKEEGNGRTTN